jgi:hypothetical protein
MYENTASVDFAVVSPVGDTRIDRIVVRADWAAQTVRLAVLTGDEGGSAPALTQDAGTTWEIPLAQASVTTAGAITLTDEREYLGASTGTTESSEADPLTLALRDANARFKVGAPAVASDVARLDTVTDHAALTTAHGAVSAHTASKMMIRDASGRAQVAAPAAAADIARLDTFSDMRGLETDVNVGETAIGNGSWASIGSLLSVVTAQICNIEVTVSASTHGSSLGCITYGRAKLYTGPVEGESYSQSNVNGGLATLTFHTVFANVAAGTHSIGLEMYGSAASTFASVYRITAIAIPTGA